MSVCMGGIEEKGEGGITLIASLNLTNLSRALSKILLH